MHVKHIQSGLSQMGNLHAFMRNSTPSKASKIINASGKAMAANASSHRQSFLNLAPFTFGFPYFPLTPKFVSIHMSEAKKRKEFG